MTSFAANPRAPRARRAAPRAVARAAIRALALAVGVPVVAAAAPAAAQAPGPVAIAGYTVVNGREIPEPLAGLRGDPLRGESLFRDRETGGCAACHRIAGEGLSPYAPQVVLSALPPEPDPEPGPELAPPPPDEIESLPEAPRRAPLPRWREDAVAELEAEAEAAAEAGLDGPRIDAPLAADYALAEGPDLTGIGVRMRAGTIRLWIVEPGFFGASAMPAFHAVDFDKARVQPDLRQPWLSPQQVEDVLAYLLSVAPGAGQEAPPDVVETPEEEEADAAPTAPASAPAPAAPEDEAAQDGAAE
ncbi:hypothetical protein ACQ5SO_09920 [Rhodovulum sp. DZ06]|uniref:hypothetical protein n=1 Tax=Rhodovulum sp. DZ06 TaxID=3425126 RepID=UPI003D348B70